MITKEQLDARLKAGTEKRAELYAAKVAEQEAAIDKAIDKVLHSYMDHMTWQTTHEIRFHEFVFNDTPLPEVEEKVKALGLQLRPHGYNSCYEVYGSLYF